MSFRIDGVGDYAQRTGAANLGNSQLGTLVVWYRKEDSTVDREIITLSRSGSAGRFAIQSSTQIKGGVNSETPINQNMATNSWAGLAISVNSDSGNINCYFYQSGTLTTVWSSSAGAGGNLATLRLGNNDAWGDSASGSFRYARFWTAILDATEIQAEFEMTPSGGTPAARMTNLFDSWLLPTGTDGSGVNSNSLTLSGGATSSEEPTIGGAGPAFTVPFMVPRQRTLLRL